MEYQNEKKKPEKRKIRTDTPNLTGIPTQLKRQYEAEAGLSLDEVRVHYCSDRPAELLALAYTQGNQVYIGPDQEKHLPHELGHVVQQMQGLVRPTSSLGGLPLNDDPSLERSADLMPQLRPLAAQSCSAVQCVRILDATALGTSIQSNTQHLTFLHSKTQAAFPFICQLMDEGNKALEKAGEHCFTDAYALAREITDAMISEVPEGLTTPAILYENITNQFSADYPTFYANNPQKEVPIAPQKLQAFIQGPAAISPVYLGAQGSQGVQAHHIIPNELVVAAVDAQTNNLLTDTVHLFDQAWNGIFLPTKKDSTRRAIHPGSHPVYTDAVRQYMEGIDSNWPARLTDVDAEFRLDVANHFRNMLITLNQPLA